MTNLREVAQIAGVNVSTISRYLTGELKVKPETEERIKNAIDQTNYLPNILAQSLRKGRTNTLAVVVPDIYQLGITGIVAGIDKCINDTEYNMIVIMTGNDPAREQNALLILRQMMIDGIILVGRAINHQKLPETHDDSNHSLNAIKKANIPVVFVSRNSKRSSYSEVCPNQENGAFQLTQHLLERGYSSIGMIVGSKKHPSDSLKIKGYKHALRLKNIEFNDSLVVEGLYRQDFVARVTGELIEKGVDALFCSTEEMAVAALQHVREAGLSVPEDIAIASYGGTKWADMLTPRLTTVDVHLEDLGGEAASLLLQMIEGKFDKPILKMLPVHLHVGLST